MLLWLTRRLAEARHGGTLAILDHDRLDAIDVPAGKRLKPPRRCLREVFDAYFESRRKDLKGGKGNAVTDASERLLQVNRLSDELDVVAALASVDVAVLLAHKTLDVLALGAMFTADEKPDRILQANLGEKQFRNVELAELGDARHQSAARWCSAYGAPAFALVVAQDGAASFIRSVASSVVVLGALQLGPEDQGILGGREYHEPTVPDDFLRNPVDFAGTDPPQQAQ